MVSLFRGSTVLVNSFCSPSPLHALPSLCAACQSYQFECDDGECASKGECDDFEDCSDGSDEDGCGKHFTKVL